MTRSSCLLTVFLLGAPSVFAQEPTEPHAAIFHAAIVAGMALHGGDAMQTAYLLGSRTGSEANPALAPFSHHPLAFGATKLGIAAGLNWAIIRLHKDHRWVAMALLGAEIGLECYAVVHNNALLPPDKR